MVYQYDFTVSIRVCVWGCPVWYGTIRLLVANATTNAGIRACTGFVGKWISVFAGLVGKGIGVFAGSVIVLLFAAVGM